jgi:hypothetical protein
MKGRIQMARFGKELRALLAPWILAGAAAAFIPLGPLLFPPEDGWIFTFAFGYLAFVGSVAAACAMVFGSEFQHRTLPLLLSQPVPRARIWMEKLAAMATVAASVLIAFAATQALILGTAPRPLAGIVEPTQIAFAALFLLALVCSAGFWSLVARSTIGGAVLSISSLFLGALVARTMFHALTRQSAETITPAFAATMLLGVVAYSGLFLWLGWRRFASFELQTSGFSGVAPPSVGDPASACTPGWFRAHPLEPYRNLLRKELNLQQPLVKMAGVYCVCWFSAVGLSLLHLTAPGRFEDFLNLLTFLYVPVALLLAGCISLGEEKGLGLHAWHLTLPIPPALQWAVKLVVATMLGMALSLILPSGLSWLAGAGLHAGLQPLPGSRNALFLFTGIGVATISIGFWASTLSSSTVKAALASGIAVLAIAAGAALALRAAEGAQLGLEAPLFLRMTIDKHLRPDSVRTVLSRERIWLLACLLGLLAIWIQSRRQFASGGLSTRRIWRGSLGLAGALLLVGLWTADLSLSVEKQFHSTQEMLKAVQSAVASLSPNEKQPMVELERNISLEELDRTGRLDEPVLRWLSGVRITRQPGGETGSRTPLRTILMKFPNGQDLTVWY